MKRGRSGKPDIPTIRCGDRIVRLRTQRGLSRSRLIQRLFDVLEPADLSRYNISEAWLARLETGHVVKLPRGIMEGLCRALNCTASERWDVLLEADRNILADVDGVLTDDAKAFTRAMARLYENPRVVTLLERLRSSRRPVSRFIVMELFTAILTAFGITDEKLTHMVFQPLTYPLTLPRQFLNTAFAPSLFGVTRGSDETSIVLIEEKIETDHLVTVTVTVLSDEFQTIALETHPPLSGKVILTLGGSAFCALFDDQGIATLMNIPSRLLTRTDGPDFLLEILMNRVN